MGVMALAGSCAEWKEGCAFATAGVASGCGGHSRGTAGGVGRAAGQGPGVHGDPRKPAGGQARPASEGRVGARPQHRCHPQTGVLSAAPTLPTWSLGATGPEGGERQERTEGRWGEPRPEAEMTPRLALAGTGDVGSQVGSLQGAGYHPSGGPGQIPSQGRPTWAHVFCQGPDGGRGQPCGPRGPWGAPGLRPCGSEPPQTRCFCLTSVHGRDPVKLPLRSRELEFRVIFTCHKISVSFRLFLKPFANTKTLLSSRRCQVGRRPGSSSEWFYFPVPHPGPPWGFSPRPLSLQQRWGAPDHPVDTLGPPRGLSGLG